MKLIAQLQLKPTPEQAAALKTTLETANAACDHISGLAWEQQEFKPFKLHKMAYAATRARFGLSAQVVVRCIKKVCDAYTLDKDTPRTFSPTGAISYDARILTFKPHQSTVSIWTVAGRVTIPFVCGEHQRRLLETQQGESDLAFAKDKFYLLATCAVKAAPPIEAAGTLGVDLGLVELATDSNGTSYSGAATKATRRRFKRIRGLLQKAHKTKKSKSAARHLKKLSQQQANFTRSENHRISKNIVETAKAEHKALALENLKGIRERTGFNREMRWQMGNWAFAQLQHFVSYKATRAGVPVVFVDPRNTSKTCHACAYCDKDNRISQAQFHCLNCGCQVNADKNAAINIAARAAVNPPIVSSLTA